MAVRVGDGETEMSPHSEYQRKKRIHQCHWWVTGSRTPGTGAFGFACMNPPSAQTCSHIKREDNFIAFYQRQEEQMLEQSVDGVKSWGESRRSLSCSLLLCSVLQLLLTIVYMSPSKMSGHGKLSRQCTVSTERPSSARPPMVDQCLSVSFCSMASYQPPREALHACSKRTRWLPAAGRQSPHYCFLNLRVKWKRNAEILHKLTHSTGKGFFHSIKSQQEIFA